MSEPQINLTVLLRSRALLDLDKVQVTVDINNEVCAVNIKSELTEAREEGNHVSVPGSFERV